MSTFHSPIVLGEKYRDDRTEIEGHAVAIFFNENGCVEVVLESAETNSNGGREVKKEYFNELRLTPHPSGVGTGQLIEYESDIELGKKYVDIQTGLEGWATILEFHELMASRVTIRSVGFHSDGTKKLVYHSIDDFLLKSLDSGVVAEKKTDKRSPVTREVTRR